MRDPIPLALSDPDIQRDFDVDQARFRRHENRRTPDECWLWQGTWGPNGRPLCWFGGKVRNATRIAYMLAYGSVPPGKVVCHNCPGGDHGLCVNPAHLWLGTQSDNAADWWLKGCPLPRPIPRYQAKPRRHVSEDDLRRKLDTCLDKSGACWLFTGTIDRGGYGHLSIYSDGRVTNYRAHRLAWTLAHGVIAPGLVVAHECDVLYAAGDTTYRRCCHPDHLALKTEQENLADCTRKGRRASGQRNGTYTHPERVLRGDQHPSRLRPETRPRGSAHGNAKLTEALVREAWRAYAHGDRIKDIAARCGVTPTAISIVFRGKGWRHVVSAAQAQAYRLTRAEAAAIAK